ncbi:MAG: Fur family transcriptional regulator [Hyphomicrobium sp.]
MEQDNQQSGRRESGRYEHYERKLRSAGVRMTEQRRVILRVLAATTDHPDANDIFHRAFAINSAISLSTVYRTMRLLETFGAIQRHEFDDGRSRYEDSDAEHHDHLIDVDTGKVIEFRSDMIEKLQSEIAAGLGYDIVRHKLVLYGRERKPRSTSPRLRKHGAK